MHTQKGFKKGALKIEILFKSYFSIKKIMLGLTAIDVRIEALRSLISKDILNIHHHKSKI